MYNSVFSMLIAAKAAEIKSNPTRTEILSEEQWLRKLIDGKKPMKWPCYNSWRPTYFRRNKDPNKLWADNDKFRRLSAPFQSLCPGEDSSNVAVPTDLMPGFLDEWWETPDKYKPDNVSRSNFLHARDMCMRFESDWLEMDPRESLGHHFSRRRLNDILESRKREMVVEVVRGGWKRLYYGSGDWEWVPV